MQDWRPAQTWPQPGGLDCLKGSCGDCFLSDTISSESLNLVWHFEQVLHKTVMLPPPRFSELPPANTGMLFMLLVPKHPLNQQPSSGAKGFDLTLCHAAHP